MNTKRRIHKFAGQIINDFLSSLPNKPTAEQIDPSWTFASSSFGHALLYTGRLDHQKYVKEREYLADPEHQGTDGTIHFNDAFDDEHDILSQVYLSLRTKGLDPTTASIFQELKDLDTDEDMCKLV